VVKLAHPLAPELGRTPGGAAASTGLRGGRGKALRPPPFVNSGSDAPRLVLGASQDQPWSEQTPGAQGTESPHSSGKLTDQTAETSVVSPFLDSTTLNADKRQSEEGGRKALRAAHLQLEIESQRVSDRSHREDVRAWKRRSIEAHNGNDAYQRGMAEERQIDDFLEYRCKLEDKRVVVSNLADPGVCMIVKPSQRSRYSDKGRRRIQAKIRDRLGRWYNCPGFLFGMTYDPKLTSRAEAWSYVGEDSRTWLDKVNQWRKRHGMPKAKCLRVIEEQPGTGYPHVHFVFPYLKWLAPFAFLQEAWGRGLCRYTVKDSLSPVSYVCKYISKMEGWSELALSYIWKNRTRLYSMSRDYTLPDYSDKRVSEWRYVCCSTRYGLTNWWPTIAARYETVLGGDDLFGERWDCEGFP
jgi:hypothetical protein